MTDYNPKLVRFDRRRADRDVVEFRFQATTGRQPRK